MIPFYLLIIGAFALAIYLILTKRSRKVWRKEEDLRDLKTDIQVNRIVETMESIKEMEEEN